jgi:PAS domain S-box-containing protein
MCAGLRAQRVPTCFDDLRLNDGIRTQSPLARLMLMATSMIAAGGCMQNASDMPESVFSELKRYVRFGEDDQRRLRGYASRASVHFARIADEFYERVQEHAWADAVFEGPEQIAQLKVTLQAWMQLLFEGPWDEVYYERRARIGRGHVQIRLPQRFVFGAMNVIRVALVRSVDAQLSNEEHAGLVEAIHKLVDIELAIMLESYREAYVEHVQHHERLERADLQGNLALSEARYEDIVEKAEALIVTLDREGHILFFNSKCERLTGLARGYARGRRWVNLFAPLADHEQVLRRFEASLAGRPTPAYEGTALVIEGGHRRVRWQFTTLPNGTEPALCAIGFDVSNEHDLAVRTRRAERLASLGTMAAGLAHEIRNPLNAAHLQLTLAARRLQRADVDLEGAKVAVGVADAEMLRLGALVRDFLDFARPQPLRLVRGDLTATVGAIVALLEPEAASQQCSLQLHPVPAAELEYDDEKIRQVLLNLVRNALEATGAGGHVALALALHADRVTLVVQDDGPGLPLDAPIFEPFFTTKEHGTGLGLAIVHRIAMDHGGDVAAHSKPGDTRFTITLPRTPGS